MSWKLSGEEATLIGDGYIEVSNGSITFHAESCEQAEWLRDVLNYCERVLWAPRRELAAQAKEAQKVAYETKMNATFSGKPRWWYRHVNDMIVVAAESPGANYVEMAEKMALKTLWAKGGKFWARVYAEHPEVRDVMIDFEKMKGENDG